MRMRPHIRGETLRYIRELLDPDMLTLGAYLGRALSCETFERVVTEGPPPDWVPREGENA